MGKWIKLAAVVSVTLVMSGAVDADLISEVYVAAAFNFGFVGDYNSGAETLTWSEGDEATVYTTSGDSINFSEVSIDLTFGGTNVDLNPGGPQAEALFTTVTSATVPGKWALTLSGSSAESGSTYYGLNMVISLQGGLLVNGSPWQGYREKEDGPDTNHLVGKAWVTVDTPIITVNGSEFEALGWDMNGNDLSGIIASTTLTQNISDYQTDWSSENVLLEIWTDENYVVPEPATLGLLGLGGVLLFWRRKHA